jgi:hypothetical protein
MEYERILLPVAGDGDVDPVVDHANSLAAALDAELLALHVVDPDSASDETTAETREPEAVFEAVADRVDEAISLKRVTAEGEGDRRGRTGRVDRRRRPRLGVWVRRDGDPQPPGERPTLQRQCRRTRHTNRRGPGDDDRCRRLSSLSTTESVLDDRVRSRRLSPFLTTEFVLDG